MAKANKITVEEIMICLHAGRAAKLKNVDQINASPGFSPEECKEDSAICDCNYHENMRAAERSHQTASEADALLQARQILIERIVSAALRGREFEFDPVDLLREAAEKIDSDAMVVVNRMPEVL